MKRVSVDIGGTFTDCFVLWDGRTVETKALTTRHNLSLGFNEALDTACGNLGVERAELLRCIDSVRYATTLGTNALIERKGPRIGLLMTAGFDSVVPLSRGRGYGEGLDRLAQMDVPNAQRPEPIVPIPRIRTARERVDWNGRVLMRLDEPHLRQQIRSLVDEGAEALVVALTNSVINPVHELRIEEIFLEEYPADMLGAIPICLSHQVAGRKGEYARTTSTIINAFLHQIMYHALSSLELNLRETGHARPMLIVHNSGGMAQLNSTSALQTVHSGPVSGVYASQQLAREAHLGDVVATDMGGTSFDIGIVPADGVKHYDFNPVIDRWLVSMPMVHLSTLGAGGGSIAKYLRLYGTVKIGPESAGSDPGPACYDRGGMLPTVTDADLVLGYYDPQNYAGGHIRLNPKRAVFAMNEALCDDLDLEPVEVSKLIKRTVDHDMANGIATELRSRGYDPRHFTILAYGGNGPLHCCGIAEALGVDTILAPPFCSLFSACGAGTLNQLHIHEESVFLVLFDANQKRLFTDYDRFNAIVAELERRGRDDLLRQGMPPEAVQHRLELDMRYGNQRVQTTTIAEQSRVGGMHDVLRLIDQFYSAYGRRYGEGSQAPEAGVRINTIRVSSFVAIPAIRFADVKPLATKAPVPPPRARRPCHFVGSAGTLETPIYDTAALEPGVVLRGPAIVTTNATTYLVEPGWEYEAAAQGAVWFRRIAA